MRPWVICILLAAAAASADEGTEAARAQGYLRAGVKRLESKQYKPALAAFRRGYEHRPDPKFLGLMAQCYRGLGDDAAAAREYRAYLAAVPDAPDRAEIESYLAGQGAGAPPPAVAAPSSANARAAPPSASAAATPPPAATGAARCPDGQSVSIDTSGHCCWPGQAWSRTRSVCVGVPRCPPGLEARGESCAPACPSGQSITPDTEGHCCWQGQVWSASRAVCVGIPQCPPGLTVRGEACAAPGGDRPAAPSTAAPGAVASTGSAAAAPAGNPSAPSEAFAPPVNYAPDGTYAPPAQPPPSAPPEAAVPPAGSTTDSGAPVATITAPAAPASESKLRRWFHIAPTASVMVNGAYLQVLNTNTTRGGGMGVVLRGGIVDPLPVAMRDLRLALRAGAGLEFFGIGDSPAGANVTVGMFYMQVPLYVGVELKVRELVTIGLDWQPTAVIVAKGGGRAGAMNPAGFNLTADFLTWRRFKDIHPRANFYVLPPALGEPLVIGFGVGAAWYR